MAANWSASWALNPSNSTSWRRAQSVSSPWVSSSTSRRGSDKINMKKTSFTLKAAKLPAGVKIPKVEPKLMPPFAGFTRTAEIWNSSACMIGLIDTFIVELILNKGTLDLIGVDVGKGLNLPL